MFYLLKRYLYGLKQAPRERNTRFASFARSIGFVQSTSHQSLFVLSRGSDLAYLLLYVDNIVLTGSNSSLVNRIITKLSSKFEMSDSGPLHHFLGISVTRDEHGLFLHQQNYAADILHRAKMVDCNPCLTPVIPSPKADKGPSVSDPTIYSIVALLVRYNISLLQDRISFLLFNKCACSCMTLASRISNALKRIVRYLKGTISHGIRFNRSSHMDHVAYLDADWTGCPSTRRSTSGYCVYLGDNLISWSSKRQMTVSRYIAKAEYRGVANVVAEATWLHSLLFEMKMPLHRATIVRPGPEAIQMKYWCGEPNFVGPTLKKKIM